uniref:Uncharacterized protein n=1 Tax=Hemiselmis andersenii TaxID=464988 RepID=A0A7S1HLA1_HEMAN
MWGGESFSVPRPGCSPLMFRPKEEPGDETAPSWPRSGMGGSKEEDKGHEMLGGGPFTSEWRGSDGGMKSPPHISAPNSGGMCVPDNLLLGLQAGQYVNEDEMNCGLTMSDNDAALADLMIVVG